MSNQKNLAVLDSIRGLAAIYVILHHWLPHLNFIPKWISRGIFVFGQEAVMVFFLLSGFVIGLSSFKTKNLQFCTYFVKRFRRIYFPFIVALLLSVTVNYFQSNSEKISIINLLGNLFMLQDISSLKPGTWVEPFLGNLSLWSLTYEWWFYMLFFVCFKTILSTKFRFYIVLLISALSYTIYLAFPNQICLVLTYFVTWWVGVELSDIYVKGSSFNISKLLPIITGLVGMNIMTFLPVLTSSTIRFGLYPFLIFRHFFSILLFVFVVGLSTKFSLNFIIKLIQPFGMVAPISYGLYVFHYPILLQWHILVFQSPGFTEVFKWLTLLALSYVVEVQLQPKVNRILR